jgi:cytoskeletal protein RodZ
MKKLTLVLLASAALAIPGAALAQSTQQNQPPQAQQQKQPQNTAQTKPQSTQQPQKNAQMKPQPTQQPQKSAQMNKQPSQQQPKQASNQPISPQRLGRNGVRKVQQTLDKDGFKAGQADGIWGPKTSSAIKNFQQSKKIQANGRLNRQTLSDLGVNVASK